MHCFALQWQDHSLKKLYERVMSHEKRTQRNFQAIPLSLTFSILTFEFYQLLFIKVKGRNLFTYLSDAILCDQPLLQEIRGITTFYISRHWPLDPNSTSFSWHFSQHFTLKQQWHSDFATSRYDTWL